MIPSANSLTAGHPGHGKPADPLLLKSCANRKKSRSSEERQASLWERCQAFRRIDPGLPPQPQTKKIPGSFFNDSGMPSLSTYRRRPPDPRREAVTFQAGILTPGSSSHRVFPTLASDMSAVFVPGYSGGPVSDFHGVPNYSSKGT